MAMDRPPFIAETQADPATGTQTGSHTGVSPGPCPPGDTRVPARLLLAEDDYFIGLDTRDTLQAAGHVVVALVGAGEKALEAADRLSPDLAILDIRLSGELDGVDVAIELRGRGIPCIFASAHTDEETVKRGARAEPLDWLNKPFGEAALLRAVARALENLPR